MLKASEILKHPLYKEALAKVSGWRKRLEKGDRAEALLVREEKRAFFEELAKKSPEVYSALRIEEKSLSELILKKLTGLDVIID